MDKNVVVTGGTKGIGRAIVQSFADVGFTIVTCARNDKDLHGLKQELAATGVHVHTAVADLSKKADVTSFATFALGKVSTIDVLINNAGVFLPGSLLTEDENNLEMMIQTNLYSAYHLSRHLVPEMIRQQSGHVFNICSVASILAYPNGGSYSISKFALLGFSKVLREELKDKGVKVTSVMPGATWSDSWKGVDLPYERLMPAEDIASSILSAARTGPSTVIEEIIIRPQLGDL